MELLALSESVQLAITAGINAAVMAVIAGVLLAVKDWVDRRRMREDKREAAIEAARVAARVEEVAEEAELKATEAAAKADEVKTTLETVTAETAVKVEEVASAAKAVASGQTAKIDELTRLGNATHILVNSKMGATLLLTLKSTKTTLTALSLVAKYVARTKDKDDINSATEAVKQAKDDVKDAQMQYDEHVAQQAIVDEKYGKVGKDDCAEPDEATDVNSGIQK